MDLMDISSAVSGGLQDVPVQPTANGDANGLTNGVKKEDPGGGGKVRCVIATGCVDYNVRVFAG